MRIQEHIGKITWSFADKILFILFGIISLIQIKYLDPNDFGLYFILININTWLFIVSDSFALSLIIQFGMNPKNRRKANLWALILHFCLVVGVSVVLLIISFLLPNLIGGDQSQSVFASLPILSILMLPRTFALKLMFRDYKYQAIFFTNLVFFGIMTIQTLYLINVNSHLGNIRLDYNSMTNIYYMGAGLSSLTALYICRKELLFSYKGDISIRNFFKFSIPITFQAAFHAIPKYLDSVIIQYFFSVQTVGIYGASKTLFRVFDEAGNASIGLVYPSAVKQIENNNRKALSDLVTKSTSFLFIVFLVGFIILELGLGKWIILTFLPDKYNLAVGMFELMMISALAIPFLIQSSVLNALNKPILVLKAVILGVIASLLSFLIIGIFALERFLPLGLVVYYFILGGICFYYVKKQVGFPVVMLFRSVADTFGFLRRNKKLNS